MRSRQSTLYNGLDGWDSSQACCFVHGSLLTSHKETGDEELKYLTVVLSERRIWERKDKIWMWSWLIWVKLVVL
jgi:hypothetical protein